MNVDQPEPRSFQEFWPYYVSQHLNPVNRFLHFVGTSSAFVCLALSAVVDWRIGLAAPVVGYGLAWVGHFGFENNRPASWYSLRHMVWSFRGDMSMWWFMLTRRMGPVVRSVAAASVILLCASPAFALDPMPGQERFSAVAGGDDKGSAGAELGFTRIGDENYLAFTPQFDLSFGPVGLGLRVPLNLQVPDMELRSEDYDETADYLRVVRYARYGSKGSPVFVRVGELAADIGHGTIMSRYMNNVELNSFRLGLQLDVNTSYGGFETVLSDVGRLAAGEDRIGVNGGRLYVMPFAFIDADSPLNIFAVGFSMLMDSGAPTAVDNTDLDDSGNPSVVSDKTATVVGLDGEVRLVRTDMFDLTPYSDLNFIGHGGWGLHLGALATLKLPMGLNIPVRAEYRRFRSDYLPTYFGTRYEIERISYACTADPSPAPKSQCVNNLPDGDGTNGYYAELVFDLVGLLGVGAIVEAYEGSDAIFDAFLTVPALSMLQFQAYYHRHGVKDAADLFAFDDRSQAVVQARYELYPFVYLVGRMKREWVWDASKNNGQGDFEAQDTPYMGVEMSFDF